VWSGGLVMSVPAVEHWKGQAYRRGNIAA